MKTQIYNIKAEKIGEIALPKSVFGVEYTETTISQAIRVILANRRSSFAKAKSRGEVHGTSKKVWAQKGTGNARHGNRTAPIFVGGGSAMGPDGLQNYNLKISKTMRRQSLNAILTKFAEANKVLIIDSFKELDPKTKAGIQLITGLKAADEVLSKSRKIGIITTETITPVKRAFGNLKNINLISLKSLNVYDLSKQNYLIFSQKAISQFK
jgi:large subunit ribosomal protein L4